MPVFLSNSTFNFVRGSQIFYNTTGVNYGRGVHRQRGPTNQCPASLSGKTVIQVTETGLEVPDGVQKVGEEAPEQSSKAVEEVLEGQGVAAEIRKERLKVAAEKQIVAEEFHKAWLAAAEEWREAAEESPSRKEWLKVAEEWRKVAEEIWKKGSESWNRHGPL